MSFGRLLEVTTRPFSQLENFTSPRTNQPLEKDGKGWRLFEHNTKEETKARSLRRECQKCQARKGHHRSTAGCMRTRQTSLGHGGSLSGASTWHR